MRAYVLDQHGGIDDLRWDPDFPDPTPGDGAVVVRVRACALNYHDLFTLRGMPGITVPLPLIIGIDIAGEIAAVGPDVTGWNVGDRVLVDPFDRDRNKLVGEMMHGGLAEYVEVGANTLMALPDDVGFHQAAALPVAYGTAYRMMVRRGQIKAGETVLVLGASGGVGTCCVQLAEQAGAHVIVAASTQQKLDRLAELGADEGINYVEQDFRTVIHERYGKPSVWTGEGGIDVVVNFTGGETWVPSLRSLRKHGRVLTCGATAGYDPATDLRFIWSFELNIIGSNGWSRQDLHDLLDLVADGRLTPVIDRVVPLEHAIDALRALDGRDVVGKVVIDPSMREDQA